MRNLRITDLRCNFVLSITTDKIVSLVIRLFTPLSRVALKNGLKIQDLEECLKRSLLLAAEGELTTQNAKSTVSRLSVMTGIHRKDIDRLSGEQTPFKGEEGLISRIVGHWQTSEDFVTKDLKPRVLSLGGESSTFSSLVSSVSKELNPATVLFELERTGVIEKSAQGIRLQKQSYSPNDKAEYGLSLLADDCSDLIDAVSENLEENPTLPNLHARTVFDKVREEDLDELKSWLIKEGHALHLKARVKLSKMDQDISPKTHFTGRVVKVVLGSFSRIIREHKS